MKNSKNITRPNCGHWMGAPFDVCRPLGSREKSFNMFQNISDFQFYHSFNVNFVGTLVLLRFAQRANISSCSGFCNCSHKLRIPLIFCGIRLQIVDCAYILRIPRQLKCTKHKYYVFFVDSTISSGSEDFVADVTKFVADYVKLPLSGTILSNTVFLLFVREIQNSKEDQRKKQ